MPQVASGRSPSVQVGHRSVRPAGFAAVAMLGAWVATESADASVVFTPVSALDGTLDHGSDRAGIYLGTPGNLSNLVAFFQQNDGGSDHNIKLYHGQAGGNTTNPPQVVEYVGLPVNNNVDNLAPGTVVGSNIPASVKVPAGSGPTSGGFRALDNANGFGETLFDANAGSTSQVEWPVGTTGYGGLRVQTATPGSYNYGYFEFQVTGASPLSGRLLSYSFESQPDAAITVAPEPTSLALLAAGVSGLALFRGRRKA